MLLIRPSKKTRFRKRTTFGFSDLVWLIPIQIGKFFFKEYGVIFLSLIMVTISVFVLAQSPITWSFFQEQVWPLAEGIGFLMLALLSLLRIFVSARKEKTKPTRHSIKPPP